MAIKIGDNLNYNGAKPDFQRQQYLLKSDLGLVAENKMPQMYLVYCLEDEKLYLYNKSNEIDPITGKFRVFDSGSSAQVTEIPEASESFLNTIVQYIGLDSSEYTTGWFYICKAKPETQTIPVETLSELKELIDKSETTATVKFEDDSTSELRVFVFNGFSYYIFEDVVFSGIVVEDVITHSDSTIISTDDEVIIRNITYEVTTTKYLWENQSVSPSSGEPESISNSSIDELFN